MNIMTQLNTFLIMDLFIVPMNMLKGKFVQSNYFTTLCVMSASVHCNISEIHELFKKTKIHLNVYHINVKELNIFH
jgi:hypothetical protein